MDLPQYITPIKEKLSNSPIISSIEIVDERMLLNRGYFRARLILINTDFLEIAESFAIQADQLLTLDYRYQWMDSSKQVLRKRWDSVKHFPGLLNFPSSCACWLRIQCRTWSVPKHPGIHRLHAV